MAAAVDEFSCVTHGWLTVRGLRAASSSAAVGLRCYFWFLGVFCEGRDVRLFLFSVERSRG